MFAHVFVIFAQTSRTHRGKTYVSAMCSRATHRAHIASLPTTTNIDTVKQVGAACAVYKNACNDIRIKHPSNCNDEHIPLFLGSSHLRRSDNSASEISVQSCVPGLTGSSNAVDWSGDGLPGEEGAAMGEGVAV